MPVRPSSMYARIHKMRRSRTRAPRLGAPLPMPPSGPPWAESMRPSRVGMALGGSIATEAQVRPRRGPGAPSLSISPTAAAPSAAAPRPGRGVCSVAPGGRAVGGARGRQAGQRGGDLGGQARALQAVHLEAADAVRALGEVPVAPGLEAADERVLPARVRLGARARRGRRALQRRREARLLADALRDLRARALGLGARAGRSVWGACALLSGRGGGERRLWLVRAWQAAACMQAPRALPRSRGAPGSGCPHGWAAAAARTRP